MNVVVIGVVFIATLVILAAFAGAKETSYAPVVITEEFDSIMARMKAAKPEVVERQMDLLEARYDLSDRPASGVTMSRGKAVQEAVRVKLPAGMTWQKLAEMTPGEIRQKGLFPKGFLPLPHPNHQEGGMLFPEFVNPTSAIWAAPSFSKKTLGPRAVAFLRFFSSISLRMFVICFLTCTQSLAVPLCLGTKLKNSSKRRSF